MRQIFLIREKHTGTWCTSSKHKFFYHDIGAAVIFLSEDNTKNAIKEMLKGLDPKKVTGSCRWTVQVDEDETAPYQYYSPAPAMTNEYTKLLGPDLEAVTFDLVEVKD